jgi:predicted esterase
MTLVPRLLPLSRLAALLVVAACSFSALAQSRSSAKSPTGESAFDKFLTAKSPEDAAKLAEDVAKSGTTFEDVWSKLKAGRVYRAQKPGIVFKNNRTADGIAHNFAVTVPENYDPARKYQMRIQLHGGIGGRSDNKPRGTGEIGPTGTDVEQFYVLPYAWDDAAWWGDDQVMNLDAIVDEMKRTYNIDENRVVLSGMSDGATGAYFIAMRDTTPYASFLPLSGFIMVLSNPEIDDGRIFPNNLKNKPWFVTNGGRDRLYPTASVEPFTKHLIASGLKMEYHPLPEAEHNLKYFPEVKDAYEKFVADHPRDPHPASLTWQAAETNHARAHWLVIDKFGLTADDAKDLADANNMKAMIWGTNQLFPKQRASGRVDLVRSGNIVTATTKGVTQFTLLLSPDVFDFNQPVKVMANGHEVFNARVDRDLKTLLKWAAKDNDRTMLYAAEVKINLTK